MTLLSKKTPVQLQREEKRVQVKETCRELFYLAQKTQPKESLVYQIDITRGALKRYFPEMLQPFLDAVVSEIVEESCCE